MKDYRVKAEGPLNKWLALMLQYSSKQPLGPTILLTGAGICR